MEITDQGKADAYFEELVTHSMQQFGKDRIEAEQIERCNLGYYAGYYDSKTRERVEHLFKCAHPIFGKIAVNGPPTPEEALAAGKAAGKANKRSKRHKK